ncbi:MAG: sensor histidine kinase [Colwellia sp.]|nr:sensor histidine kinase [Colwellia sp.]MCW9082780.1 sensor histidine kinase [Colwellia sp.]
MSYSLQKKLASGLLVRLISSFIVLWVLVNSSVSYLTYDYVYTRLTHDTETIIAAIIKKNDTQVGNVSSVGSVYQQPFSGHYFEVIKNDKRLRSRSLWDQKLTYPNRLLATENRLEGIGPMKQPLLLLASKFIHDGEIIMIVVAEDVSSVEQAMSNFNIKFTVAVAIIMLIVIFLQIKSLRKGLRPLAKLRQDLISLETGKISSLKTDVPIELSPLVTEINHLHQALALRISRHRNALSDLAHALKKPLTVLQQLSKEQSLEDLPNIKEILIRQTDNTQQLTQRILNKARLAGTAKSGSSFSFDTDLNGLIDTLSMMYCDKNISATVDIPPDMDYLFDREDMLELLGNVLDNAYKWANSIISIEISQNARIKIIIEDDGPGIPFNKINTISERGVRLDESVDGHGIGLGIVNDIIEHYEGEITYGNSDKLGGFKVIIKLP